MNHICQDCGHEMEVIQQAKWNGGFITLITCQQKGCSLSGVTLTPEQYSGLSAVQLDEYRQMVAKRAIREQGE